MKLSKKILLLIVASCFLFTSASAFISILAGNEVKAAGNNPSGGPSVLSSAALAPGLSRQNPFPAGKAAKAPNWNILVIEIKRGQEAWKMIHDANMFNDPPPKGMEYLLAKIRVRNTSPKEEEHPIRSADFKLTGTKLVQYDSPSVVAPEPDLDARLFPNGAAQGWVPLIAAKGETKLILVFDELLDFEEKDIRFIALEKGASLTIPGDLAKIKPSSLGKSRSNPAPIGAAVVTEDWTVVMGQMIRGEEAWKRISAANQFNPPPPSGMEYVLANVRVRYIGGENLAQNMGPGSFKTTGSANVLHNPPPVVSPSPELDVDLFPGGRASGWVPLLAKKGETQLKMVFEPLFDFSGANRRYLKLEP